MNLEKSSTRAIGTNDDVYNRIFSELPPLGSPEYMMMLERELLEILLIRKRTNNHLSGAKHRTICLSKNWLTALTDNRLQIISSFAHTPRNSRATMAKRNQFVIQIADRIVFGYISGGKVEKLKCELVPMNKTFEILDCR